MSRNFDCFLKAYEDYAIDNFSPPQFNTWVGLSVLAGALERRVWLPWSDTYSFYPNIYVLLVSKPGQGKSVSLNKGTDLLKEVSRRTGFINIMPNQVTEAKFIELMGSGRSFIDRSSGKELTVFQNAGYYYASEASNSLRNIFGDFIACLTDFYDCPTNWSRGTKKDGKPVSLKNVCMNILAGSTFDYLGKLVSDENIQGGFASRLLYVVENEPTVKVQPWQSGHTAEIKHLRKNYASALIEDLTHISNMVGPMHGNAEFGAAWEAWYPEHQKKVLEFKSEKLQSILARTNTNVLKVSMLLSAAESDDRIMKLHHFQKAVELVEGLNARVPGIFREAKAVQAPTTSGRVINQLIFKMLESGRPMTKDVLVNALTAYGHQKMAAQNQVEALMVEGGLGTGAAVAGHGVTVVIKGNPNDYF